MGMGNLAMHPAFAQAFGGGGEALARRAHPPAPAAALAAGGSGMGSGMGGGGWGRDEHGVKACTRTGGPLSAEGGWRPAQPPVVDARLTGCLRRRRR